MVDLGTQMQGQITVVVITPALLWFFIKIMKPALTFCHAVE